MIGKLQRLGRIFGFLFPRPRFATCRKQLGAALALGALALVCIAPLTAQAGQYRPRVWTSADGNFTLTATLVEVQADQVVVERAGGGRITVPLAKLSAADQAYVQSQTAPPAPKANVPNTPPNSPDPALPGSATPAPGTGLPTTGTGLPAMGTGPASLPGSVNQRPPRLRQMPGVAPSPFTPLSTLKGHAAPVASIAFSLDGSRVVSCSLDGQTLAWETQSGQQLGQFAERGTGPILSVGVSPDNRWALLGDDTGKVSIWDISTGKSIRVFNHLTAPIRSVAISDDGRLISAVDCSNGYFQQPLEGGKANIFATRKSLSFDQSAISPRGEFALMAGMQAAGVSFLNQPGEDPQSRRVLRGEADVRRAAACDRYAAVVSSRGYYRLYRVEDIRRDNTIGEFYLCHRAITPIIWSRHVALTRDSQHLILMDPYEGCVEFTHTDFPGVSQLVQTPALPGNLRAAAISPDGLTYAFGFADGSISVWKLAEIPLAAEAALHLKASALLQQRAYTELDALAEQVLKAPRQAGQEDGQRRFRDLAFELSSGRWYVTDQPGYHEELLDWTRQRPESVFAQLALSIHLLGLGWPDGLSDLTDEAAEAQGELKREFLEQARDKLLAILQRNDAPLLTWDVLALVARGLDWKPAQLEPYFARLRQRAPDYHLADALVALTRSPQFGGEVGAAADYATQVADSLGGDNGDMAYAQIGLVLKRRVKTEQYFPTSRIRWPRLKRGLQLLADRYPHDRELLRTGLHLAWDQEDNEAGLFLLGKLDERFPHWQFAVPNNSLEYQYVHDWARGLTPPAQPAPRPDLLPLELAKGEQVRTIDQLLNFKPTPPASPLTERYRLVKRDQQWKLHPLRIHAMAYTPDGQYLAAGDADGNIQIWDAAAQKVLDVYPGHGEMIASLAWSGDGQTLFATTTDHVLRGWQQGAGLILDTHQHSFKLLTAGRRAISLGKSHVFWDAASLQPTKMIQTPPGPGFAISFDGRMVATSTSGQIEFHAEPGVQVPYNPIAIGRNNVANRMAWSRDGSLFAYHDETNLVVIEWKTGRVLSALELKWAVGETLFFMPDNRTLVYGTLKELITIDALGGFVLDTWPFVGEPVLSPDGNTLISSSNDQPVIYSVEKYHGPPVTPPPAVAAMPKPKFTKWTPGSDVNVVPTLKTLPGTTSAVAAWPALPPAETIAGGVPSSWERYGSAPYASKGTKAFSPAGLVAHAEYDRQSVTVRDYRSGKVVSEIPRIQPSRLALSDDGQTLAAAFPKGLALFNVQSGKITAQCELETFSVENLILLPNDQGLVACNFKGIFRFRLPDLELVHAYDMSPVNRLSGHVHVSPAGTWLAVMATMRNDADQVLVYNTATGELHSNARRGWLYGFSAEDSLLVANPYVEHVNFLTGKVSKAKDETGQSIRLDRSSAGHFDPDSGLFSVSVDANTIRLYHLPTSTVSNLSTNESHQGAVLLPGGVAAIVRVDKTAHFYRPQWVEPPAKPNIVATPLMRPAPRGPVPPRARPLPPVFPWPALPDPVAGADKLAGEWIQYGAIAPRKGSTVTVSPAGLAAYIDALRQSILVYDLRTGRVVGEVQNITPPGRVRLSPDGLAVAYLSPAGVQLFEIRTGRQSAELKLDREAAKELLFLPDGKQAVLETKSGARLLDLASMKTLRQFTQEESSSRALSPGGNWLALASSNAPPKVSIFNTSTGEALPPFSGNYLAGFLSETRLLYKDQMAAVFDIETRRGQRLPVEASGIPNVSSACVVEPSSGLVATNYPEGKVTIFDLKSRGSTAFSIDATHPYLHWLDQGAALIVEAGNEVWFYSPPRGQSGSQPAPPTVARTEPGTPDALGTSSNPNPATPWPALPAAEPGVNALNGEWVKYGALTPKKRSPVTVSPSGLAVYIDDERRAILVHDLHSGKRHGEVPVTVTTGAGQVSPDGKLLTHFHGGDLDLYLVATRQRIGQWRQDGLSFRGLSFLPDSQHVLVATTVGVRLLSLPGLETVREFSQQESSHLLSPDGKWVAFRQLLAVKPTPISIANTATGEVLTTLPAGEIVGFLSSTQLLYRGQELAIFDLETRRSTPVNAAGLPTQGRQFAVEPTSGFVATAFPQGQVTVFDLKTRQSSSFVVGPSNGGLHWIGNGAGLLLDGYRDVNFYAPVRQKSAPPAVAQANPSGSTRPTRPIPAGPTRPGEPRPGEPRPTGRPLPPPLAPRPEDRPTREDFASNWPGLPIPTQGASDSPDQWKRYGVMHSSPTSGLSLSAAGLVAHVRAGAIVVANFRTGEVIREIPSQPLSRFALSADGASLASVQHDQLSLHDIPSGKQRKQVQLPLEEQATVGSIQFLPGGKQLLLTCEQMVLQLDGDSLQLVRKYNVGQRLNESAVAVSPAGKYLAAWDRNAKATEQLRIFDLATGNLLHATQGGELRGFLNDTQLLLGRYPLELYDLPSQKQTMVADQGAPIPLGNYAAIDFERQRLASQVRPDLICFWDFATSQRIDLQAHMPLGKLYLFPGAPAMAVQTSSALYFFAPPGAAPEPPAKPPQVASTDPAPAPTIPGVPPGVKLRPGSGVTWRTEPLSSLPPLDAWPQLPSPHVNADRSRPNWQDYATLRASIDSNLAVSPAELLAYVNGTRRSLVIVDYRTGDIINEIDLPLPHGRVQLSTNGETVIWAFLDTVTAFEVRSGKQIQQTKLEGAKIRDIAMLPEKQGLVVVTEEDVRMLTMPDLKAKHTFATVDAKTWGVSPSGKFLAIDRKPQPNRLGGIRLYETATGLHVNTLGGGSILCVVSDKFLISGGVPFDAINLSTGESSPLYGADGWGVHLQGLHYFDADSGLFVACVPGGVSSLHLPTMQQASSAGPIGAGQPVIFPGGDGLAVLAGNSVLLFSPGPALPPRRTSGVVPSR